MSNPLTFRPSALQWPAMAILLAYSASTGLDAAAATTPEWALSNTPYPPGVQDESAYRDRLSARSDSLAEAADADAAPQVRAQLLLAWANHLLSLPMDEPATAWLLGIATPEHLETMRTLARKAAEALDRAEAALDEAEENAAESAFEALDRLRRDSETLTGFAATLAALSDSNAKTNVQAVRLALIDLAAALEHENAEITQAARLWYAAALNRIRAHTDALTALEAQRNQPHRGAYDFFSWLVRCQIVADRGGHAVALAVTQRLEERCATWFRNEQQAAEARRAVALVRARLARQWAETYQADDRSDAVQKAERIAERAEKAARGDDDRSIYRLTHAVPLWVTPPKGSRVTFLELPAYSERVVLVLDRPEAIADDWPALHGAAVRFVRALADGHEFQVFLPAQDGAAQIGAGEWLAASDSNRQRAVDLLEAASPVARTRVEAALRHALTLKPDRLYYVAAGAADDRLIGLVENWNEDKATAIDVVAIEGVSDSAVLERLAGENRGRYKVLTRPIRDPGAEPTSDRDP